MPKKMGDTCYFLGVSDLTLFSIITIHASLIANCCFCSFRTILWSCGCILHAHFWPHMFFAGMLAAEAAFDVLHEGSSMEKYWDGLRNSWIWEELHKARNYRPVSETIKCILLTFLIILSHLVVVYTTRAALYIFYLT